ncbi:MAG: 16S rRNA (guanine(966)-N(2))-methyltransferase RsmD [Flavobacteriaceae bacterium]|nr:16S rRNA (guanine(966)-N(2))-methyltransferase RsmD [Flavobacteriaceae bacterium]|tara:strand:+ start:97947 stop:98483 length:537 start_codon:yes stop_codon:yes gene_type:complete
MRIISGKHKSRRITPPKGLPVRPTTDFAKEGLFNILNNRISFQEIKALELFAGTGNISFELASRGAKEIIAVDADIGCVNFIKKTSFELDMPIQTFKADVFKYLDFQNGPFDLIFADPPYAFPKENLEELVHKIMHNNWLAEEGVLILEHSKEIDLSQVNYFQEHRRYGGSVFSFFQK